ncbi:MAG: SDR family NAD(P)-dependent oxidoreductase [Rhizobiales bacterium]|nr:SDR family NAD(P)-dependent oxidoreductase [Hyphomicrobiales bacterium]
MSAADIRLDGAVAIVTGAARGLGQAMAAGLARAGANVVLADVDAAALSTATGAIAGQPTCGAALGIRCDITSRDDCENVVGKTLETFGALHVLVNNAAMGQVHLERSPNTRSLKFWESDPDIWQKVIVTNVNGTFLMARTAVPHMLRGGFGRLINVTTSLATMQRRNNSPYGVTKAAIEAETLIWAQELKDTGVTVNSLIPGGAADTEFVHEASRKELAAMGRTLLPPSVMVPPVLWLASRMSDGITGARFVGKLWNDTLPPGDAATKAREPSVLLPATDGR